MDLIPLFEHTAGQQHCPAGAVIFETGDRGDVMYVILEGEVDICLEDGPVHTARAGEFFGEMALVSGDARSATAIARSDCRLAPVSERRFLLLVQQTPAFSLHMMRVMAERLRRTASLA